MARRISIYQWLRKLHLYAEFIVLGFLLMYFLTGYMMTHSHWFPKPEPEVSIQTFSLDVPENMNPEQLSEYVQNKHNLRGKQQPPQINNEGKITLNYVRPGYHYQAPDRQTLEVKTTKQNMYATFVVFHRLHGYGGGWVYNLYILMMDLSSIALIVFALTGFYMWFKLLGKRALGWILLAISFVYTFLIVYAFLYG